MIAEVSESMTNSEIMLALIRSELSGDIETARDLSLSEEDMLKLYRLSKSQDVAHIIYSALYKRDLLTDSETSGKFKKAGMLALYRLEKMKYALREIEELFSRERIEYIPLKGAYLRSLYPEERMRTSCDIDILVRENDLEGAAKALTGKLGYKLDGKVNYHDVSLYSPGGVHLELHFSIKENLENIDALLSRAWDYSRSADISSAKRELAPEYFVFYHIAHMSYHFIHGGCGVKPFMDLAVIQGKMKYDDAAVRDYCDGCGILKFYDNMLRVADVWFGDGAPSELSRRIEEFVLRGGAYGSIENKVALAQGRRGGRIKYAFSRIFISYDSLKNYYPIIKKHRWLYPFMQIRRWFRIVFFGGLGRGVAEMNVNGKITKEDRICAEEFLNSVGL